MSRIGIDPTPSIRRPIGPPPYALIGVYRAINTELVERLVAPARARGAPVGLWALDAVTSGLADLTVGSGPGGRFDLLNRVLERRPPPADHYLVVADDDIILPSGIDRYVAMTRAAKLDLAMPAHFPCSHFSHELTRRRRGCAARLTTYVEIGPLLSVSPEWRDRVTPFPVDSGLGWGTEIAWAELSREGCRLGIVDATPVLHVRPPGRAYDAGPEMNRLAVLLRHAGVPDDGSIQEQMRSLQHTTSRWHRYRSRPPW